MRVTSKGPTTTKAKDQSHSVWVLRGKLINQAGPSSIMFGHRRSWTTLPSSARDTARSSPTLKGTQVLVCKASQLSESYDLFSKLLA